MVFILHIFNTLIISMLIPLNWDEKKRFIIFFATSRGDSTTKKKSSKATIGEYGTPTFKKVP